MRIGILTFHAALNYGSVLQAYALQEYLVSKGHEVKVIDFRSRSQRRLYPSPISLDSPYNIKQTLRRIFSDWKEIRTMASKRTAFRRFISDNLHLTDICFKDEEALRSYDWSSFDMIVTGSDQIWNPSAIDFSLAYFLDFLDGNSASVCPQRVAYAPSAGPSGVFPSFRESGNRSSVSLQEKIKVLLSEYDALSVREKSTADFLFSGDFAGSPCPVMPDPVLLHDAGFYRSLAHSFDAAAKAIAGQYILYYSPGKNDGKAELLADAAAAGMLGRNSSGILPSDKRLRIVRITDGSAGGAGKYRTAEAFYPASPAEFISLIDNAACTVGTSYHLLVLSMLLGKDFMCPDAASDSRKAQLLKAAGMSPETSCFRFSDPDIRAAVHTAVESLRASADSFWSGLGV